MLKLLTILWKYLAVVFVAIGLNITYELKAINYTQFKACAGLIVIWALARLMRLLAPVLLARFSFFRKRRS